LVSARQGNGCAGGFKASAVVQLVDAPPEYTDQPSVPGDECCW